MATDPIAIAVVGSGVTGLAAAVGFARRGCQVALCGEMPPSSNPKSDEDMRVFALNDASCDLLQDLGAWDKVFEDRENARRTCHYERMEVWSGCGRLSFSSTDIGRAHLGVIVENYLLRTALFECLQSRHNVTIYCPAKLQSMHSVSGANSIRLTLDDGRDFEAALVVGADGAGSKVRTQARLDYHFHAYEQHAIVAVVECGLRHRGTCLQRFSDMGVTAFLPLSGGEGRHGSIVWACDKLLAKELAPLSDRDFGEKLSQTLEQRLGDMLPVSKRAVFPLYGALAEAYIGDKVALVGDAAHSVHPLAGQGVNMGLADVRDLLRNIISNERLAGSVDINRAVLRRYERSAKARNASMKHALDTIHRWFDRRGVLPEVVQAASLNLVDRCSPLKTWFMRRAMGADASNSRKPRESLLS